MKPISSIPSAFLLAAALGAAGAAGAASVEPEAVLDAIDEAGVGGDIAVSVDDAGVAKLSGAVDDPNDGMMAVNAARDVQGVTRVIDLLRADGD